MKLLAIVALAGLSGCGTMGQMDLVKVAEPRTVTVTWVRELPKKCGDGVNAVACTSYSNDFSRCTITALQDAPDHVIAHEFRHCFGYVHTRHVGDRKTLQ